MRFKHPFLLWEAQRTKHCLIGIKDVSWEGGISLELPVLYPGEGNVSKPPSQSGSINDSIKPPVPRGTAGPGVGWILTTLPPKM